jgi:hypothetical protein
MASQFPKAQAYKTSGVKQARVWLQVMGACLQGEAGSGLSDTVRKYRQSVFKLNYKIKKNAGRPRLSRPPGLPAIPATGSKQLLWPKQTGRPGVCCFARIVHGRSRWAIANGAEAHAVESALVHQ